MAIGTEHRLDSYHVNIGVGDCAVHVHVCVTWDDSQGYRKVVARERRRLVLVDGGYAEQDEDDPGSIHPSGQFWNLQDLMKMIKEVYTVPFLEDANDLRFDAVVITHWDMDHYSGIFHMLELEFNNTIPTIAWPTVWSRGSYRPSMFKYDPVGFPLTVLYIPVLPPENLRSPRGPLIGTRIEGNKAYLSYQWNMFRGMNGDSVVVRDILQIRHREQEILGTEILSGRPLQASRDSICTLRDLVITNPPPIGQPGMYCIAVRQQILGPNGFAFLTPSASNYNNKTSIALVIAWQAEDVRASHYFAGDLDGTTENRLSAWMHPTEISTMKASHHGAFTSTPLDMLHRLKPRSIIFSAAGKHGHPRTFFVPKPQVNTLSCTNLVLAGWELIISLWYHFTLRTSFRETPLYSTAYPYYFAHDGTQYSRFPEISVEQLKGGSRLRRSLQELFNVAGGESTALPRFDDELQKWQQHNPSNDGYQFAMSTAKALWFELSCIDKNASLLRQAEVWKPGTLPNNQIAYLRVDSSNGPGDGDIFVRYRDSFSEATFNGLPGNAIESTTFTGYVSAPTNLTYQEIEDRYTYKGPFPSV